MVAYSFQQQFVAPILLGLGRADEIEGPRPSRAKRQTIRAIGRRRHARPGDMLQLYTGMRTRSCKSIGVAKCTQVLRIKIAANAADGAGYVEIDGEKPIVGRRLLDEFARSDGFSNWTAMCAFWRERHKEKRLGPFVGLIIRWEPVA